MKLFFYVSVSLLLLPLAVSIRPDPPSVPEVQSDPPPVPDSDTNFFPIPGPGDAVIPAAAVNSFMKWSVAGAVIGIVFVFFNSGKDIANFYFQKRQHKWGKKNHRRELEMLNIRESQQKHEVDMMNMRQSQQQYEMEILDMNHKHETEMSLFKERQHKRKLELMSIRETETLLTVLKEKEARDAIENEKKMKMKVMRTASKKITIRKKKVKA